MALNTVEITRPGGGGVVYERENIEYRIDDHGLIILSSRNYPATGGQSLIKDFAIINPSQFERIEFS